MCATHVIDGELVDLPQAGGDGRQFWSHTGWQIPFDIDQPLEHQLPRAIHIDVFAEDDGDLGQAELRDRSHFLFVWQAAHRDFERKRYVLFHLLRRERRSDRIDLDLIAGDVRHRVNREVCGRVHASCDQDNSADDDQHPPSDAAFDNPRDHSYSFFSLASSFSPSSLACSADLT